MRWATSTDLRGDPNAVRLSASLLDRRNDQCRDFAAIKARPLLWPKVRVAPRYPPWESFPLGVVMIALDAVEFEGAAPEQAAARASSSAKSPLHPGAAAWVRHACVSYAKASAQLEHELAGEGIKLHPERNPRVVQASSPVEHRILTVWGRWYASVDGAVREFRRVRISRHSEVDAPSTLAAAFVAATGKRAIGEIYREVPITVRPDDSPVERVRVVEVLLTPDVPPRVLVDTTPEEIQDAYRQRAQPVAIDLVAGGSRIPGRDCSECKLQVGCESLPSAPGLLGLTDKGTHRRTWSVTTARLYEICPAQAHMRDLRLTGRRGGDNPAIRRGIAIHEWLRAAHGRPMARECTILDLPDPDSGDIGLADGLMTPKEYGEVYPYLLGHLEVCPLVGPDTVTDVNPEPVVAVHDPDADVVMVAEPDLIRRVGGRLVYREQKTSSRPFELDRAVALHRFQQLALAVCLIAAGVFEDTARASHAPASGLVELEVMTPLGAKVMTFNASDPAVLTVAKGVVRDQVVEWHRDTEFRATPGDWCAVCPAAQWCPDKGKTGSPTLMFDGMVIDAETGELLQGPDEPGGRAAALAAEISEPDFGHDDESSY